MGSLLQHPQPELPITDIVEPPQKGLHGITSRLRQKVCGEDMTRVGLCVETDIRIPAVNQYVRSRSTIESQNFYRKSTKN